jgi:hypothetical protein
MRGMSPERLTALYAIRKEFYRALGACDTSVDDDEWGESPLSALIDLSARPRKPRKPARG